MKTHFKGFLIILLFLSTVEGGFAQTENWAVGVKVGEPIGLNIRKYGDRNALDITLGTYGGILKSNADYRKGDFRGLGVSLNATYLWYGSFFNDTMIGYAGIGGQINKRRYYGNKETKEYSSPISLGPAASAGLEYFLPDKPLSIFVETGFYMELLPGIGYTSPQFNVGVRHNF